MPKEYVEDKYTGDDNDDVAEGSFTKAVVGWSKESEFVQMATVAPAGKELGRHSIDMGYDSNGWFLQLDRHQINRLIRILRRARDDAFGRDA